MRVNIAITKHAQEQVKSAIRFRARSQGESIARDRVKAAITNWKVQLETMPESGKACAYFDDLQFREMIKGDYRLVYEIRKKEDTYNIYLLIFCHVRMNYETLIRQFNQI
ncbi:type II toxin-antitoxin system RelE/ParE family toxin [Pseudoalteromonas umbrosa]|uniref:type II toxin-antitoxin system RelE/ParE family toxin n=1 Tax=Pseudoalteromonas umbrosa TaxID=3048489 RepID=UPI0024C2B200|nr:type II toxin-antitoxin system RelE/ParE family toxin [Pseudoalteromonas sp. B95]MDK1290222.1 type II toxin-antitoxin system RelE/ParE family toxin [Pseudoalteromonas sp. B95]